MAHSGAKRTSRSGTSTPLRTPTRRRLELHNAAVDEAFEEEDGEGQREPHFERTPKTSRQSVSASLGDGLGSGGTNHGSTSSGVQHPEGALAMSDAGERPVVSPQVAKAASARSVEGIIDYSPSLCSEQLEVHGFSHLRESISFGLPQTRGSVPDVRSSCGVLEVGTTLVPHSTSRSSALSSHTSSKQSHFHTRQSSDGRRPKHGGSRSDLSFLSTRSAIAYLKSTAPAAGVGSPKTSGRSSQATPSSNSFSRSTLGPLELSPIPKENSNPHGRRRNGYLRSRHQPPPSWPPVDVPVAVANCSSSTVSVTEVGRIDSEMRREFRLFLAYCIRIVIMFIVTCSAASFALFLAAPLVVQRSGSDGLFVRQYVESVAELQLIYGAPSSSLTSSEAKQLYLRMVSESLERLDQATLNARPKPSEGPKVHEQYYSRMTRAYQAVRYRVALYARSRHRSWFYRNVLYPLHDVWKYGVVRHGAQVTREECQEILLYSLWVRIVDVAACLRQDENMPCPTLNFLKGEVRGSTGPGGPVLPVASGYPSEGNGVQGEVSSKALFAFVAKNFRHNNREYNHLYFEGGMGSVFF
ncbi:hypothetical protein, conserved [Trypanosoma brucei gambiense DAL972]|uniref:Uncharacterized protein n=1 Tax=Trypanosoma brucei gambiense (strain MHOM/CI/86/DAL972) TaxID=679716 RepID=D0A330_TRYB9|nr:hypothetical protein, conserved [Trypanosoma brucei gambiense DAL972]CBH15674.1 hypothetical protein, conserved [Trypanosoma brucei gambiense DAL972]|eukprot:XP_011777938.1 hypothetical protein, conserved [Trypanosoma brucei gambiense DAL972]